MSFKSIITLNRIVLFCFSALAALSSCKSTDSTEYANIYENYSCKSASINEINANANVLKKKLFLLPLCTIIFSKK